MCSVSFPPQHISVVDWRRCRANVIVPGVYCCSLSRSSSSVNFRFICRVRGVFCGVMCIFPNSVSASALSRFVWSNHAKHCLVFCGCVVKVFSRCALSQTKDTRDNAVARIHSQPCVCVSERLVRAVPQHNTVIACTESLRKRGQQVRCKYTQRHAFLPQCTLKRYATRRPRCV